MTVGVARFKSNTTRSNSRWDRLKRDNCAAEAKRAGILGANRATSGRSAAAWSGSAVLFLTVSRAASRNNAMTLVCSRRAMTASATSTASCSARLFRRLELWS